MACVPTFNHITLLLVVLLIALALSGSVGIRVFALYMCEVLASSRCSRKLCVCVLRGKPLEFTARSPNDNSRVVGAVAAAATQMGGGAGDSSKTIPPNCTLRVCLLVHQNTQQIALIVCPLDAQYTYDYDGICAYFNRHHATRARSHTQRQSSAVQGNRVSH